MKGLVISATGTNAGKTWLTRGLGRLASRSGLSVAALKPIETGVDATPGDALALGRAVGRAELAFAPGLVRRRLPASPHAAMLAGEAPIDLDRLLEVILQLAHGSELTLVESAGGLFVPLDRANTFADLARALELPLVLAAPNTLGVLSHALATIAAATALELQVVALVLMPSGPDDASTPYNARILRDHLAVPVHVFPRCADDDDKLASAAIDAGLEDLIGLGRRTTE